MVDAVGRAPEDEPGVDERGGAEREGEADGASERASDTSTRRGAADDTSARVSTGARELMSGDALFDTNYLRIILETTPRPGKD